MRNSQNNTRMGRSRGRQTGGQSFQPQQFQNMMWQNQMMGGMSMFPGFGHAGPNWGMRGARRDQMQRQAEPRPTFKQLLPQILLNNTFPIDRLRFQTYSTRSRP